MKASILLGLHAAIFVCTSTVWAATSLVDERLQLDEIELRLLIAERNLQKMTAATDRLLGLQYRGSRDRLRRTFENKRQPIRAAIQRHREEVMARLTAFAAQHPESSHWPEAMLRLAVLQMDEADEFYQARMRVYLRDPKGEEPRKDYARALVTLKQLLTQRPNAPTSALALYLAGYCYLEQGEAELAVQAFEQILGLRPGVVWRAEILVRIGDFHFDRGAMAKASAFYRAAMQERGPWRDRAWYKYAWSLYRMNRYTEAVTAFTQLAEMGAKRSDLQEEALQYLAISYVEGYGLNNALAHIATRGERSFDTQLIRKLADVLYESTDFANAAAAYDLAMQRSANEPQRILLAQRKLAALHQQRDIERAVALRRSLADEFGPRSSWYAQQSAPVRNAADELIERFLYEYATFHHYRELRGVTESVAPAEEGYRTYLARYRQRPRAVQMAFYLAEMLYDRGAYAEALSYYTQVAYSAPDPATSIANRAAYNMVLAARKLLEADPGQLETFQQSARRFLALRPTDPRAALVAYHAGRLLCERGLAERCRQDLSRMIEAYPSDPLALEAMQTVLDSFAAESKYAELAAWADRWLQRGYLADQRTRLWLLGLVGGALFREAVAYDRRGDPERAAERYLRIYDKYAETVTGVAALYNAAYALERGGRYLQALELYARVAKHHPTDRLAARAMFRSGKIYESAYDYAKAISFYTAVASRYVQSDEASDALFNVGALQALLGQHTQAATTFEAHFQRYGSVTTASVDTLLRAAVQWQEAGRLDRARSLFEVYARLHPRTPEGLYAGYRAYWLAPVSEQSRRLDDLLTQYEAYLRHGGAAQTGLAAALRFERAERLRDAYLAITLPAEPRAMAAALTKKARVLKDLQVAYSQAAAEGDAELTIASLYRIGEAYLKFADMLFEAPMPSSLSPEEIDVYKAELDARAAPIEEKAFEALRQAEASAHRMRIQNRWTVLIHEVLHAKTTGVRLVTAGLEPPFRLASVGLPAPIELSLPDGQSRQSTAPHLVISDEVDGRRIVRLLSRSASAQRIVVSDNDVWIERLPAKSGFEASP